MAERKGREEGASTGRGWTSVGAAVGIETSSVPKPWNRAGALTPVQRGTMTIVNQAQRARECGIRSWEDKGTDERNNNFCRE